MMDVQEVQSNLKQVLQAVDSIPAAIIAHMQLQQVSSASLYTGRTSNPLETYNGSLGCDKKQLPPLELPYNQSESGDKPSTSIMEDRRSFVQGKILVPTSVVLINRTWRYGCTLRVGSPVHLAHSGSKLLLSEISDILQNVQTK
jgi:hypothetical protein